MQDVNPGYNQSELLVRQLNACNLLSMLIAPVGSGDDSLWMQQIRFTTLGDAT